MVKESEQTISAYLDGESVAPSAVLEALETEEGREALVEFVRLRVVTSIGEVPGKDFYARMREAVPGVVPPLRRPLAWTVGAGLAACLTIGFFTGQAVSRQTDRTALTGALPPTATRVIEFQQGIDWHKSAQQEVAP